MTHYEEESALYALHHIVRLLTAIAKDIERIATPAAPTVEEALAVINRVRSQSALRDSGEGQ